MFRLLLGTIAPLVVAACSAGAAEQGPTPVTRAQIAGDIAIFKAAFDELHPSLHRYASPADVAKFFEAVERRVPRVTTELDLYRALAPFSAVIKDGHTELHRPESAQRSEADRPVLPIGVHVLGDRLWVARSHTPELPRGSELIAIDGVSAADVLAGVLAAEPRDGNSESGPRWTLSRGFRFVRQMAALVGERPSHVVRFTPPGASAPSTATVQTTTLRRLREAEGTRPTAAPVSLETIEGIPVLTVRAFSAGIGGQMRDAIRSVVEHASPALVVDVRGNGGGIDTLGLQLFSHIAAAPFTYYRELPVRAVSTSHPLLTSVSLPQVRATRGADGAYRMTTHPNLGTHTPDAVNYKGRVIVLMDGGSFSTTAEFLAAAKASGRATFVGAESGGAECGNTSGTSAMVMLPATGLHIELPLVRYEMAVPCDGRGRGVLPDISVPVTIDDLIAGVDRQLARAIASARAPAQPSQPAAVAISSETPAWSPDGARLVFSSGPSMQHQIYVIDADGTGARRLTEGPEQNRWPSWSPDGRSIVFMSDRDGQAELYSMNADGSAQRRLTHTPVHEFAPAWSPRGDAIVYITEMPGSKQQLFRMNPDGTGARQIDGDHLYYGRPSWSPDGSAIYVGAHRNPGTSASARWKVGARIYRIARDGSSSEALTPEGFASNPWPTPDGGSMVFDTGDGASWSSAKGEWDLWTLVLAGGARKRITSGESNDWGAAYSHDGKRLAFSSGRDRVYSLVVMDADGSGRRVLTRTNRLPDAR